MCVLFLPKILLSLSRRNHIFDGLTKIRDRGLKGSVIFSVKYSVILGV